MVRAMSDEGGGRGARSAGQASNHRSRHAVEQAGPMMGRRTLVESAPTGAAPVHSKFDSHDGGARTEVLPRDDRETSAPNAVATPISILDLFGPPASPAAALTATTDGPPVQRKSIDGAEAEMRDAAVATEVGSRGTSGAGSSLPHLGQIQASFGHHDVSGVQAHQDAAAAGAANELGATAYAFGNAVAFAAPPDLHTAAHEAAHVVQQRGGVQLADGVDRGANDPYEQQADEVADTVVAGRSAAHLLDATDGDDSDGRVVQRSPKPGATDAQPNAHVPARGDYLVERTADGSYVFVFNTSDRKGWSEPVLTGLGYYMHQAFPGVGDAVIRTVFTELKVRLDRHGPATLPDDRRYELQVDVQLHRDVIAWMAVHHPELAPQAPRLGGGALHAGDTGGTGGNARGAHADGGTPHGATMAAEAAPARAAQRADKVSAQVEQTRALYERLRKAYPEAIELGGRSAWPAFLAYVSDHAEELRSLLHDSGRRASHDELRKLLAQFQAHEEVKQGDSAGEVDGETDGKLRGSDVGTKDGDVRTSRDGGIEDGSIYGEPGGDAHGWHRWAPKGQLRLQPTQPTYVVGSIVQTELAWDLSVHPEAGQILLPNHCTYVWTVHHDGKLIDLDGRSILADDRRASLRLGKAPGMYEIAVTATSKHFKKEQHRFSSRVLVRAVSEQEFDRAAFDEAQVAGPEAAFSRDDQGALHLRPEQTARTTQDEISNLDLTRGGIDALAAQGKITGSDHEVAVSQIDKQREALIEIQAKVKNGTPYIVRGTFVSREDSSTTPLRLMMHVLRRAEAGGVARYELVLHDTTFGEAVRHPGRAAWRLDHDSPSAVYRKLEGEALDEMAEHFHAHNDYPKGTVHLAAQRLASDSVWEKTLDTANRRKTAKKILGTAALIGGAAMLIVPGGSVVAAGLMVVTSTAGVASVALEVEDRLAKEGNLKLDRRLAMDVLQVVAISLPFGTLTRTFAEASLVGKGRFLLCMTGLDIAQGFMIASDVQHQLAVIEANTAVQLAGVRSDEQRAAIHAERDRRVAEVIGGAVVNGGFLLVSLGGGIKRTIAITRAGARFAVREPVRELVKHGRERMEQALSTDTFEHGGQRIQLTGEERRYLEHEIAARDSVKPQDTKHTDSAAKPAEDRRGRGAAGPIKPSLPSGDAHADGKHPTANPTTTSDKLPVVKDGEPHETHGKQGTVTASEDATGTTAGWVTEVAMSMTPEERAKWKQMQGKRSPEKVRAEYGGDIEKARAQVKKAVASELGIKTASRATADTSAARIAEIRRFVEDKGLMKDPRVKKILDALGDGKDSRKIATAAKDLRSLVITEIVGNDVQAENKSTKVMREVQVWIEQDEATIVDYKTAHSQEFKKSNPGLKEIGGKVYREMTDMDLVVAAPGPDGGPATVLRREEIKTGSESASKAKAQLTDLNSDIRKALSNNKQVKLFKDGDDITSQIDVASIPRSPAETRGPEGRGFDRSLGITLDDLDKLVTELLQHAHAMRKGSSD
jgi:hypothetical protein